MQISVVRSNLREVGLLVELSFNVLLSVHIAYALPTRRPVVWHMDEKMAEGIEMMEHTGSFGRRVSGICS